MQDIITRIIPLPRKVKGLVSVDEDGVYNVYISASLTREEQLKTFRHECKHIDREDLFSDLPVEALEEGL